MSPPNGRNNESDLIDRQLVAYLDGELGADEQHDVEERLADDPDWRNRLRDLQQAWDLLDELPSGRTDRSFTQTTVELVATKAADETSARQKSLSVQRRFRWLRRGGGIVAALLAGYFLVTAITERIENRFLAELPVLDNIDLYRHAESVEFLRRLDQEGLFTVDDVSDGTATESHPLFTQFDLASIRERFDNLPPEDIGQLQRKNERFDDLDPSVQAQMRQLHASVAADPQHARLQQIMAQYHNWLKNLTPGERAELLELSATQRVDRIDQLQRKQEAKRFRSLDSKKLTREDFDAILAWWRDFIAEHEDEILRNLTGRERAEVERARGRYRRHRLAFSVLRHGSAQALSQPDDTEMGMLAQQLDLEKLAQRLSPNARESLESAVDRNQQIELVHMWTRAAAFARRPPDRQELEKFYKEVLDKRQREQLESLPAEQFREQLQRLYFRHQMRDGGRRGWPWSRNSFGGPRGGPSGPRSGPGGPRGGRLWRRPASDQDSKQPPPRPE